MVFSRRRDILSHIRTKLLTINGGVSAENSSYTYHSNVYSNVYRGFKMIDKINDFPTILFTPGLETYTYNTVGNTEATLDVKLRAFVYKENSTAVCDDLIEDIDHLIYNMRTDLLDIGLIRILSVDTDQGLLEPYGVIEVVVQIRYEVPVI